MSSFNKLTYKQFIKKQRAKTHRMLQKTKPPRPLTKKWTQQKKNLKYKKRMDAMIKKKDEEAIRHHLNQLKTGKPSLIAGMHNNNEEDSRLPKGWEKVASRSRRGQFSYRNIYTK